jgi:uncharacterized protein (DUF952 family)
VGALCHGARLREQIVEIRHGSVVAFPQCSLRYPARVPPQTYHLVPAAEWHACDQTQPYVPSAFAADGFVHCTDGADELAATANRYFSEFPGELLALVLDVSKLTAPLRYEDPRRVYPHVYGPIDREAIVEVRTMPRDQRGTYLPLA